MKRRERGAREYKFSVVKLFIRLKGRCEISLPIIVFF
jgi:hypothetical protein